MATDALRAEAPIIVLDGSEQQRMEVETGGEQERALQQVLSDVGLSVRANWLQQVLQRADAGSRSARELENFVFEQALYSDLRVAGDGTLPPSVASLHKQIVQGKHFLQALAERYDDAGSTHEDRWRKFSTLAILQSTGELTRGSLHPIVLRMRCTDIGVAAARNRCLKLMLTDGRQTLVGMEFKHIKDLSVDSFAGVKVMAQNFEIRRGIAMFGPHNLQVLGGMYADLETKRLEHKDRIERAKKRFQLVAEPAQEENPDGDDADNNAPRQRQAPPSRAELVSRNSGHMQPGPRSEDARSSPALDQPGRPQNNQSNQSHQSVAQPSPAVNQQQRPQMVSMDIEDGRRSAFGTRPGAALANSRSNAAPSGGRIAPERAPAAAPPRAPAPAVEEVFEYEEVRAVDEIEEDPAYEIMMLEQEEEMAAARRMEGQGASGRGRERAQSRPVDASRERERPVPVPDDNSPPASRSLRSSQDDGSRGGGGARREAERRGVAERREGGGREGSLRNGSQQSASQSPGGGGGAMETSPLGREGRREESVVGSVGRRRRITPAEEEEEGADEGVASPILSAHIPQPSAASSQEHLDGPAFIRLDELAGAQGGGGIGGSFQVRAASCGATKFKFSASGFSLQLTLVDGTGVPVNVTISNAVIEGLIGVTCQEYEGYDKAKRKEKRVELGGTLSLLKCSNLLGGWATNPWLRHTLKREDPDGVASVLASAILVQEGWFTLSIPEEGCPVVTDLERGRVSPAEAEAVVRRARAVVDAM